MQKRLRLGIILALIVTPLVLVAFWSPAVRSNIFEDDNNIAVLTRNLLDIGAFVDIVAFALIALGIPKADLTADSLNLIGMAITGVGVLGLGIGITHHILSLLPLGMCGVWAGFVSLRRKGQPYRPDARKPPALSDAKFQEALVRMRDKSFSVAYEVGGDDGIYQAAELVYSELKSIGIPVDRVWGDGSVTRGTAPSSEIDARIFMGSPSRPGFDCSVIISGRLPELRKMEFETAFADDLVRTIISAAYIVTV